MRDLVKLLVIGTISLTLALIPEIVMFFIYQSMGPTTFWESFVLLAVFFIGGGSFCIIFGLLGISLFIILAEEL